MIYKYFDCNAAYLTVKNDFLKFSDPNDFNDCYEMVINVKEYSIKDFFKLYNRKYKIRDLYLRYANIGLKLSFDEFIDKLKDDSFKQKIVNHDKKAINSWLDEFPMIVSKVFSMSCFSKSFESILMWAHYADKYKGCVIGFDYDEYKEYAPMLFDVRYKAKPIVINPKYCFGQKNIDLMKKVLTTKYIDWKYEHEIRFIYPNDYLQKMDSENGLVKGLFGCNMHIKQIILGNRCKNEQLIAELSKLSKAMNIPFAYGRLKSYEYKIETMSSV